MTIIFIVIYVFNVNLPHSAWVRHLPRIVISPIVEILGHLSNVSPSIFVYCVNSFLQVLHIYKLDTPP